MKQIAIALDQLANTMMGGWADETLSARAWRLRDRPLWNALRRLIDIAFFWQRGHCRAAYDAELQRLQSPPEERHG